MAMMISWVAPVNPSHPYLENDPAPSFDRNICAFHLGFSLEGELFDRQVVVVTPECDLVSDFLARQQLNDNVDNPENRAKLEAKLLNHIHLCEIYKKDQIRPLVTPGHTFWERNSR